MGHAYRHRRTNCPLAMEARGDEIRSRLHTSDHTESSVCGTAGAGSIEMSVRTETRPAEFIGTYAGIAIAWRAANAYPSAARVAELYSYDPDTGVLTFKSKGRRFGQTAGWQLNRGKLTYLIAQVDHKQVPAHRIAWAITTGEWPPPGLVIDHKNGNGLDNRWANLRLATQRENTRNRVWRLPSSGFRSVRLNKRGQKWVAVIHLEDGPKYLGTFSSAEEAATAHREASIKYFGEFSPFTSRDDL